MDVITYTNQIAPKELVFDETTTVSFVVGFILVLMVPLFIIWVTYSSMRSLKSSTDFPFLSPSLRRNMHNIRNGIASGKRTNAN